MQFDQTLQAGIEVKQQTIGRYFAMLTMGGTSGLTVQFFAGNELLDELRGIARIFSAKFDRYFDRVVLKSANTATVQFVISDGTVEIQGGDVNATIIGTVPVSNDRGSVGNPVNVTAVTVADAPATSITSPTAAPITAALSAVVAANANRRALRIYNQGPDAATLGPTGHTWAKRAVVIEAGQTFFEDRAANLAISAICDAGKTATLGVQEVIA